MANISGVERLVGKDLAGFKIVSFLAVAGHKMKKKGKNEVAVRVGGLFKRFRAAEKFGKGIGPMNTDVEPIKMFLLTEDGKTGWLLSDQAMPLP